MNDNDPELEQRYRLSLFGWLLVLFLLTWTAIAFHSCMIKGRLDRIERKIQLKENTNVTDSPASTPNTDSRP